MRRSCVRELGILCVAGCVYLTVLKVLFPPTSAGRAVQARQQGAAFFLSRQHLTFDLTPRSQLFGVDVVPATGIDAPKWHEDVQVC